MLGRIFGWLTALPIERLLRSIDHRVSESTERDNIKTRGLNRYVEAQAGLLAKGPWSWFPLFFIAPLGFWWAAVCVYSVLWCQDCAFPQDWTIAALPGPLNDWAHIIIGSLFIAKYGERLAGRLGRG